MLKGSVHPKDITIVNIYITKITAPECVKKKLLYLTREIDSNPNIVGDFNTILS